MADAATAAEKDPLLSHGAHEIRNPVAVILGYVRILTSERLGPLTDGQRKALGDISTSTTRLAGIADEMSLLARLLAGNAPFAKAHIELAGLIAAEIPSVPPAIERDVAIRVIDNSQAAAVNGDAHRLRGAFNALMFSQRRELFTTDELCVAIDRVQGGNLPPIRVTIGGADRIEELRRVPRPDLTTLIEFRGGVGYRLSIARLVIEGHGGQVFSKTEPGSSPRSPLIVGAVIFLPEA